VKRRLTIRRKRTLAKRVLPATAAGAVLFGMLAACGPSLQSIHEGSVRFEHCYRLDLDPKIAPTHRHACWQQWLEVYSYGQSRDRIEHAHARLRDLEAGDPNPPALNLEHEAREARQFYMSTPGPTNVHASPPPVAPAPAAPTPLEACVATCQDARQACDTRCAGAPPSEPSSDAVERKTQPAADPKPAEPAKKPSPKAAATPAAAADQSSEESTESECNCEQDYKTCGMRCFE